MIYFLLILSFLVIFVVNKEPHYFIYSTGRLKLDKPDSERDIFGDVVMEWEKVANFTVINGMYEGGSTLRF